MARQTELATSHAPSGFDRTYVTRLLCLAFLAPEITKAILEGRQPTRADSEAAHQLCTQDSPTLGRSNRILFGSYLTAWDGDERNSRH